MVLVLVKKNQLITREALVAALEDQPKARLRELLVQLGDDLKEGEEALKGKIDQLLNTHSGSGASGTTWVEDAAVLLADNGSFIDENALGRF